MTAAAHSTALPRPRSPQVLMLVHAATDFGALHTFSRDQAAALGTLGVPAHIIDVSTPHGVQALRESLTYERPRAVVAFAGIGAEWQADGISLYEAAEVPYVGLMTDSPVYQPLRHRLASPWQVLQFPDPDFLSVSLALAAPHAMRGLYQYGIPAPPGAPKPLSERPVGLVYCKSGGQQMAIRDSWPALPRVFRNVLEDVLAVALQSSRVPLWDLVRARIADDGLMSGLDHTLSFCFLVHNLDVYIRAYRATRLFEALLPFDDAVIIGGNWAHVDTRRARARLLPGVSLPELLPWYDNARVVASVQPLMRCAPQERVIYGMQRGAVVLTDAEEPLADRLGPHRFQALSWDGGLTDAIADALRDPARWQPTVTEATAFARTEFSPQRSAEALLTTIGWIEAVNAMSFSQ
jgi:hypothetical protein